VSAFVVVVPKAEEADWPGNDAAEEAVEYSGIERTRRKRKVRDEGKAGEG
jgi:hypothetical protein